jgi:hypothetical protein
MWFSKKKEEKASSVPKLPDLPELPKLPNEPAPSEISPYSQPQTLELNSIPDQVIINQSPQTPPDLTEAISPSPLPNLPNSETGDKFQQDVIKSALQPPKYTLEIEPEELDIKEIKYKPKESKPIASPREYKDFVQKREEREKPETKKEPIFVRIDKFQQVTDNLKEIRAQVAEIESYLRQIRDIKAKEENELIAWENEVLELKNKLDSVDSVLLSKIE